MRIKTVYQTLENKDNADHIQDYGPFKCTHSGAWLGEGYYFWESYIENAHWWGETIYKENGYVICEATYDFNEELCFDLYDNPEHVKMLENTYRLMLEKGLSKSKMTVPRVIKFLKDELKVFNYEGVRVYGVNSKDNKSDYSTRIPFKMGGFQYADLSPAIQICFFNKKSLNLRDFRIIYPDHYNDDFAA